MSSFLFVYWSGGGYHCKEVINCVVFFYGLTMENLECDVITDLIIIVLDLAWDWINKKLYWININTLSVEVMDPDTGYQKVLHQFLNNYARNIILDPLRR